MNNRLEEMSQSHGAKLQDQEGPILLKDWTNLDKWNLKEKFLPWRTHHFSESCGGMRMIFYHIGIFFFYQYNVIWPKKENKIMFHITQWIVETSFHPCIIPERPLKVVPTYATASDR